MIAAYERFAELAERVAALAEGGDTPAALALDAELASAHGALPASAPAAARPLLMRALLAERRLAAALGVAGEDVSRRLVTARSTRGYAPAAPAPVAQLDRRG